MENNNTVIRKAQLSDLDEIVRLEKVCFNDSWSEESLKHDLEENERALYVVAEVEGKIAGYMNMWCVLDEGQVVRIAVSPEFRRRHIGEKILRSVMEMTGESGAVFWTLDVRTDNIPAIEMYRKLGFRDDGIRKKYYSEDNCDALLMHCEKDWI